MGKLQVVADRKISSTHPEILWSLISHYVFDKEEDQIKFSDKLSRKMLWSKEYTLRAIEEYRKFMFLACVSKHPVTPSLEVDEVWHMHLLYTKDYWNEFRLMALKGQEIHHGPTRGVKEEDARFVDWYQKTKESYYMWFSEEPPIDIWPPSEVRFRNVHFVQVDLLDHWVIRAGDWKGCLKALWWYIKWKIKKLW